MRQLTAFCVQKVIPLLGALVGIAIMLFAATNFPCLPESWAAIPRDLEIRCLVGMTGFFTTTAASAVLFLKQKAKA
jgi:hypothetical protein